MKAKSVAAKSKALEETGKEVFGDQSFEGISTHLGIVASRWHFETPMIFKTSIAQAHGSKGTFVPGFGCALSDAFQASCSAYPFFEKKLVTTNSNEQVLLIDGGYCANNPTLYALADALLALGRSPNHIRLVSVGVGDFPLPTKTGLDKLIKKEVADRGRAWTRRATAAHQHALDGHPSRHPFWARADHTHKRRLHPARARHRFPRA